MSVGVLGSSRPRRGAAKGLRRAAGMASGAALPAPALAAAMARSERASELLYDVQCRRHNEQFLVQAMAGACAAAARSSGARG